MAFDAWSIVAGLLFSTFGLIAFRWGKPRSNLKLMLIGVALMGYSWFTPNPVMNWVVGIVLTFLAYTWRNT
ncbi:MAG: hypothetical protein ABIR96_06225 [Bdellovibrionota bacterium]